MEINAKNMDLLYRVGSTKFQKAFSPAKSYAISTGLCDITPMSTIEMDHFWLARLPAMREWLGAKVVNGISAHSQKLVAKYWEVTFGILREHVKYDQFNMFNFALTSATERANKLIDYKLADLLRTNPTVNPVTGAPLYYDGEPFFSTAHPISGNSTSQDPTPTALTGKSLIGTTNATLSTNYGAGGALDGLTLILNVNGAGNATLTFAVANNALTPATLLAAITAKWPALTQVTLGGASGTALKLAAATSIVVGNGTANTLLGFTNAQVGTSVTTQSNLALGTPLTHSSYSAAFETMLGYTDEQGKPFDIMPDTLFVGPALRRVGKEIVEAKLIANTSNGGASGAMSVQDNVEQGTARLVVVPEWGYSPGMWMLAQTNGILKPFTWGQAEAPHMVPLIDPTSPNVFMNRQFLYSIEAYGEITGTLWPLAYYGNSAPTFGG